MVEKEEEEFELVPLSPIRRLEKRVEKLESSTGFDIREIFHELIDIVRMNQQIVDELAKANDALRIEISKLPGRIEALISSLNELLSYIKASASEEVSPGTESLKPLLEKMDLLIESNKRIVESNESITSLLEDIGKRLKKPLTPIPMRRPMLPPPKL